MPVVTISGNLGSYAREIGQLVAGDLGLDYVDRGILSEAARALGVSERAIAARDDGSPPPTRSWRLAASRLSWQRRTARRRPFLMPASTR